MRTTSKKSKVKTKQATVTPRQTRSTKKANTTATKRSYPTRAGKTEEKPTADDQPKGAKGKRSMKLKYKVTHEYEIEVKNTPITRSRDTSTKPAKTSKTLKGSNYNPTKTSQTAT